MRQRFAREVSSSSPWDGLFSLVAEATSTTEHSSSSSTEQAESAEHIDLHSPQLTNSTPLLLLQVKAKKRKKKKSKDKDKDKDKGKIKDTDKDKDKDNDKDKDKDKDNPVQKKRKFSNQSETIQGEAADKRERKDTEAKAGEGP
eukprot:g25550.t1